MVNHVATISRNNKWNATEPLCRATTMRDNFLGFLTAA